MQAATAAAIVPMFTRRRICGELWCTFPGQVVIIDIIIIIDSNSKWESISINGLVSIDEDWPPARRPLAQQFKHAH